MRWRLADAEINGQPALFDVEYATTPTRGSASLAGLQFLPVTARRVLNRVPPTSPMPFRWTINAYRGCSHAGTYCFARPTHTYLGLGAGVDFDQKIVVKVNAVDKVRHELAAPGRQREHVAMGTNTDPYQRAEGKYRLTRGIVQALGEHRTPFSILTKSAMVARDVDVLVAAAQRTSVSVTFSIGTLSTDVWRATEPGTPHPRRRLDAMRVLADAGLPVAALIAPVLPGLSDRREQIEHVVAAVHAHGGTVRAGLPLYLRGETREHFLTWLAGFDPALHARYQRAYAGRTHLPAEYGQWLSATVSAAVARHS